MKAGAEALEAVQSTLSKLGIRLDTDEIVSRFGWPTQEGAPDEPIAAPPAPPPGFGGEGDEENSKDEDANSKDRGAATKPFTKPAAGGGDD
jgi:hypothetical protein